MQADQGLRLAHPMEILQHGVFHGRVVLAAHSSEASRQSRKNCRVFHCGGVGGSGGLTRRREADVAMAVRITELAVSTLNGQFSLLGLRQPPAMRDGLRLGFSDKRSPAGMGRFTAQLSGLSTLHQEKPCIDL